MRLTASIVLSLDTPEGRAPVTGNKALMSKSTCLFSTVLGVVVSIAQQGNKVNLKKEKAGWASSELGKVLENF